MKRKMNIVEKRISNRRYPLRNCKKPECSGKFIPHDARQTYCCEQHRIDFNNDKRKQKEKSDVLFLKTVKKNEAILKKARVSAYYKKNRCISKFLLDYDGYDFNTYHSIIINKNTGREAHICYEFALELIDAKEQYFSINNILDYEL